MTTNTNTFGTTCGRAIGSSAAHSVHFVAVALTATGRFGADLASGASAGYQDTAALRKAQRLEMAALRAAAGLPEQAIACSVVQTA